MNDQSFKILKHFDLIESKTFLENAQLSPDNEETNFFFKELLPQKLEAYSKDQNDFTTHWDKIDDRQISSVLKDYLCLNNNNQTVII